MAGAFLVELVRTIAERHGVEFAVEPEFRAAARLSYANGEVRYLRGWILDINTIASATFARARAPLLGALRAGGLAVPETAHFHLRGGEVPEEAREYARHLGFPVVVKASRPSGSPGARLAHSRDSLSALAMGMAGAGKAFLIQRPLFGASQLSVVVFDREAVLAYVSSPMMVRGDGRRTVQALVEERLQEVRGAGWEPILGVGDPRIEEMLAVRGLSWSSVPAPGEEVQATLAAGPAFGGQLVDASGTLPPDLREGAIAAARLSGLRFCKVDLLLVPRDDATRGAWFTLDVDPNPDLQALAELGPAQLAAVEALVERMVLEMGRPLGPSRL